MTELRRLPIYGKKPENMRGMLSVSPSQIESGRLCLRRWKRSYVDYFKEPQAPSAAKGDRVHLVLQAHLSEGTPLDLTTDEGRIADSGKEFLPPPKTGKCEGGFFIPVTNQWGWTGKIDWEDFGGLLYIDHKTTSDFRWIKSVDTLHKDPQGVLYGYKVIGDKSEQPGRWIYYRTRGANLAKPVDFTLTRDQVAEGIAELEQEAEDLIALRQVEFLDLPPNPDACHAFGRPCPHMGMCSDLNGSGILKGMLMATKTKDELLASLRANAIGAPVVPVATVAPSLPVANQPAPVQPANTPVAPAGLLALLPKAPGAPAVVPMQPLPALPEVPVAAPTPVPDAVTGPAPTVAPEGANGPSFEPVTNPGTPEAKRTRGRPPGSKNKPRDMVSSLSVDSAQSKPIPGPVGDGSIPEFGTLYVNCMPMHDEEYTVFPQVCTAGIVVDTRTFLGRDNLAALMQKACGVVMPIP